MGQYYINREMRGNTTFYIFCELHRNLVHGFVYMFKAVYINVGRVFRQVAVQNTAARLAASTLAVDMLIL